MKEHFLYGVHKAPKPKNKVEEKKVIKKPEVKKPVFSAKPKQKEGRKIETVAQTSLAKKDRYNEDRGSKFIDKILKIKKDEFEKKNKGNLEKAYKDIRDKHAKEIDAVRKAKERKALGIKRMDKKLSIAAKKVVEKKVVHYDGRKPFGKQGNRKVA